MSTILHADLDAFYASVEQRDDPSLRDRPMLVGGGVVLSASYEARAFGIRTAMGGGEARRLCPAVIEVPARMSAYSEASERVFEIFNDMSPNVEGLSIDEAFLDVTGLWRLAGSGEDIAAVLRQRVFDEVGLPISVGVASTKFLAKVASGVCKPDGLLVVEPGRELEFLHPLPVEKLWGVGRVTAQRLRERGLRTVADVAALDEETLVMAAGKAAGRQLFALAHNRDARRVEVHRRRRSIGSQRSFPGGGLSRDACDAILLEVTDGVTTRMRKADRVGRTVVLRLRFGDFVPATRSRTLSEATFNRAPILAVARQLLAESWSLAEQRGLTRVGLSVTNLTSGGAVQLAFDLGGGMPPPIDHALDEVRERFGKQAIGSTRLLGRADRSVPLLPD